MYQRTEKFIKEIHLPFEMVKPLMAKFSQILAEKEIGITSAFDCKGRIPESPESDYMVSFRKNGKAFFLCIKADKGLYSMLNSEEDIDEVAHWFIDDFLKSAEEEV